MKKSKSSTYTVGIDLGDKSHEVCVLDADSSIVLQESILNKREALLALSKKHRGALIIMEASTHSPWISRLFESSGHGVVVANPRKVRAIYDTDNKNDKRDAELLARIGRMDRNLLYGVTHKSEEDQRRLKVLDVRDNLVRARVVQVNSVRGIFKSLGISLPKGCSTEVFSKRCRDELNAEDIALVEPSLKMIECLTDLIKTEDKRIQKLINTEYPAARKLMSVPGVGPVTALAFVLVIGSPDRFKSPRDVGPYMGLVPKRDQSGETDKELRISKCGNGMLRRLLVSCAQYTLGAFGPPSALREAGLRKALKGAKVSKKKAVVMVARKLSVMLLALWKDPASEYAAFPKKQPA